MLKLFGIPQSRALRPLWLLHQLDLPYELVLLDYRGDALSDPDYPVISPNVRIPHLVDAELVLWESMAIDVYLAHKQAQAA